MEAALYGWGNCLQNLQQLSNHFPAQNFVKNNNNLQSSKSGFTTWKAQSQDMQFKNLFSEK